MESTEQEDYDVMFDDRPLNGNIKTYHGGTGDMKIDIASAILKKLPKWLRYRHL
jgi:hypothetical protein